MRKKAAFAALALACQVFGLVSPEVQSAPSSAPNQTFVGSPISSVGFRWNQRENDTYAAELNEMAYELIMAGSYTEAEGRLRQAILFEPEFACAHCNLGYVLNRTGRANEALPHLQIAFRLAPNEPAIIQSLAAAYQLKGNFQSAIDLYKQYLNQFPSASDHAFIVDIIDHLKTEAAANAGGNPNNNFNWNKRHVRIFVQPADNVAGFRPEFNFILQNAFFTWSQAGVLSFEFVSNAEKADIECVWTDNAKTLSSNSEGGETVVKKNHGAPSHAYIKLLTQRQGNTLTERDVRGLCLHEIGHSLGLMKHSASPDDIMFCTLAASSKPSSQDFQNLRKLYP